MIVELAQPSVSVADTDVFIGPNGLLVQALRLGGVGARDGVPKAHAVDAKVVCRAEVPIVTGANLGGVDAAVGRA